MPVEYNIIKRLFKLLVIDPFYCLVNVIPGMLS